MLNWIRIAVVALAAVSFAAPAMAQGEDDGVAVVTAEEGASMFGNGLNGLGMGLVILGAGLGIGRIGGQAVEAMSRQPEAAGNIQTGMIIAAALIEGAAFFALALLGFVIVG